MNYPESLNNLINSLKKLPTIGEKSAERLAFAIMNMDDEEANDFSKSIIDVKSKIKKCKICGNITENEICEICNNDDRDKSIICVVEDCKNIITLEKMGSYQGKYHVLNGLISPIDGKGPDDIEINSLINKIDDSIKEVIIAISPTLEGETTALYISKLLENKDVIVSRIAYGIPMGADMEYLDPMTLSMALTNRNKIS
jgi:recombination protein RecR